MLAEVVVVVPAVVLQVAFPRLCHHPLVVVVVGDLRFVVLLVVTKSHIVVPTGGCRGSLPAGPICVCSYE